MALTALANTVATYGFAYLITVGDDHRSHVVAASPDVRAERITVSEPGRRSSANAQQNAHVTLVWPPPDRAGYSLIVDGVARIEADLFLITPERAVLHRPAPQTAAMHDGGAGGCGSDCVELPVD